MDFCGVAQQFGMGSAQVKLPSNRVTFFVRDTLPGFSRGDLEAACMEAWKRWERVIGITVDKHPNPKTDTTQIVTVASLDGPSGVLADQQLPFGMGVNLQMRIDRIGPWTIADNPQQGLINLLAVLTHENGHALGMQHIDADGDADLMNATYRASVFKPQDDDISYGRKLYGPPIVTTPGPTGMPAEIDAVWEAVIGGVKYRAKGKAKRVE